MYAWSKPLRELSVIGQASIRLLQIGLHYVLPYALAHQFCTLLGFRFPWTHALGVELGFYYWLARVKLPRLKSAPLVMDPLRDNVLEIWKNSMDRVADANRLGYPMERWISGWFLGAQPSQIGRENLLEWIASNFLASELHKLDDDDSKAAAYMADDLCSRIGLDPSPGYNKNVRCIRFLHEPLFILQRSLLQYVIASWLPRLAVGAVFRAVGLKRACCSKTGLCYWWRVGSPPSGDGQTCPPDLIFFHGLCGFTGYLPLILRLLWDSSTGAVLVELEDISQCLNLDRWPSRQAVVDTVNAAVDNLQHLRGGIRRSCVVVSHSLGTGAAVWILEEPPTKNCSSCLCRSDRSDAGNA